MPLMLAAHVSAAPQSATPVAMVDLRGVLPESADGKTATHDVIDIFE